MINILLHFRMEISRAELSLEFNSNYMDYYFQNSKIVDFLKMFTEGYLF